MLQAIWRFLRRPLERLTERRTDVIVGGIAFYTLLSLFPFILLFIMLTAWLAPEQMVNEGLTRVARVISANLANVTPEQAETVLRSLPNQMSMSLVLSGLIGLYSAAAGMRALMSGMGLIAGVSRSRGYLVFQSFAIGVTTLLVFAALAASLLITSSDVVFEALALRDHIPGLYNLHSLGIWVIKFAVLLLLFFLTYLVAVPRRSTTVARLVIGSVFGAGTWLVVTVALRLYFELMDLTTLYGSLTSFMAILLWIYFSCYALLVGGAFALTDEAGRPADETPGPA